MVGKKEISMASHQKNKVAGSSSCFPMSLHFLLLLVKRLDTRPMGQGNALASNLPAHRVSQTISNQMQNHTSCTPPTEEFLNRSAPSRSGMRIMRTGGVMYTTYRINQIEP